MNWEVLLASWKRFRVREIWVDGKLVYKEGDPKFRGYLESNTDAERERQ